jgi:ABC-type nickel/cobalt efflux system permease component RcnA
MIILASSAALIGFVHSLAPGHWLPVVLLAKARKWSLQTALLGAAVAASGHILISNAIGAASIWVGSKFFASHADAIENYGERYGSLLLILFGLAYAASAYFRHSHCHGHTHHGPDPGPALKGSKKKRKTPFVFLFSLGFSPCIAVLPVFATAAVKGAAAVLLAMVSFSVGVLLALMGSTVLASHGLAKIDHPIFEHYGDVLTGLGIFLMGVIFFFIPI